MSERAMAYLAPQSRTWPVLTGIVPFLGEGYARRPESGLGPWDALRPGLTVILGPDGDSRANGSRLRPLAGTGKTQQAAAFATKLWAAGELDLLVWVDAGSRDSIVSGYARALADIKVAAQPDRPEASAARFLRWLEGTGRRWLVVLDGVADLADADGLWPYGPSGQVLVTTRLTGLRPQPARPASPEQISIAVPGFSQREALDYISARLNDDPYQAAGSLDLAIAVECQPIGLALAVSYLRDSGQDCRQYRLARERYKRNWSNGVASDPLAASWMLAVDRARQFAPTGLAWPAIKLAAVLGPARVPGAVLTSSAACAYVTERRSVTREDQDSLRAAFANLQRLGLVMIEPDDEVRTVWMPAGLQFSIRQVMTPTELRQAVVAAADAICESWPGRGPAARPARPGLDQALRDCAVSLRRCDDLALWDRGCHPLLVRVGQSLDDAQMHETAHRHWRELAARSAEYFGAGSPLTMDLRERLAKAATAAGRTAEATSLREQLVADVDQLVGPNHPQAIAARASLTMALHDEGRLSDAISMGERVVADSELVLGPAHPQTAESLDELGVVYAESGRYAEAIGALERCLAVREQTLGLMHSQTSTTRYHLAEAYRQANQLRDAILLHQDVLAQIEGASGGAHPDTIAAREKLAIACYQAGQTDVAVATLEQALADWQRVPGATPADTLSVRANLAAIYCQGGRLKEAVPLYEGEVTDRERISGAGHPGTLRAKWKLAAAWHKAKRVPEAIKLGEATLTDCEQILGPGHWDTLIARANLAHAYHSAGLLKRASAQFDRALHDGEQSLGADDPLTEQVRALRKRYLGGRQGAAPIIAPPAVLPRRVAGRDIGAGVLAA